jgi:hypothetical protein
MRGSGLGVNKVKQALMQKMAIREQWADLMTAEPCLVEEYDVQRGIVSVSLKNFPHQPPMHGVRVVGSAGDTTYLWGIVPFDKDPANATVGIVLFLRSDATLSFHDRRIQDPPSRQRHGGQFAVFIPGALLDSEDAPPATTGETPVVAEIGDAGIIQRSTGSSLLLKKDGGLEAYVKYARFIEHGKDRGDLGAVGGPGIDSGSKFLEST